MTEQLLPRLLHCSAARLNELWDGCEVNRNELLEMVTKGKKLNERATPEYIVGEYRRLCASYTLRGVKGAPGEFVYRQFAEDAMSDRLTFAQVIYGFKTWRRKKTSWAPTYGEFLDCVLGGQQDSNSTMAAIPRFEKMVRALIDPKYTPEVNKPWERRRFKPEPQRPLAEKYAEARDLLDVMQREKEKGGYQNGRGDWVKWNYICELMLKGVQGRVEMFEAKVAR